MIVPQTLVRMAGRALMASERRPARVRWDGWETPVKVWRVESGFSR